MKKILILFAHPAMQKSRINKILINGMEKIEGVTFHDLYQTYPEFDIDIKQEQQLAIAHDIIIFHHPLFWYSTPAILKEWQDLVLEHSWAYGSQGHALDGKIFFNIITTGGSEKSYSPDGYNNFTIRQLLTPIERTANLCRMVFLPPFVIHGTHSIEPDEVRRQKEILFSLLSQLVREKINSDNLKKIKYLNDYSTL